MRLTIEKLIALGLLLALLALPLQAANPVQTIIDTVALAPGEQTTYVLGIETGDVFGVSCHAQTTSTTHPVVVLTLRYAMLEEDTHVIPTSQDGTPYSTSVTVNATDVLSDLTVPPAGSVQVVASNADTLPVTVTVRSYVK